jgi:hypothetical protein
LLLVRLHPPHGQADEPLGAMGDREKYDSKASHYSGDAESKALYRVLENGFYATSDDNVNSALRTIDTGVLRRAEYFSTWPDGTYKAAMGITNTELDIDGIREFTSKFAELQRQREEAFARDGIDVLPIQAQEVFGSIR